MAADRDASALTLIYVTSFSMFSHSKQDEVFLFGTPPRKLLLLWNDRFATRSAQNHFRHYRTDLTSETLL